MSGIQKLPRSVEEAAGRLARLLSAEDLARIKYTPAKELYVFSDELHGLVRKRFDLDANPELIADCARARGWESIATPGGLPATRFEPEEAAEVIVEALRERLRKT